MVVTKEEVIVSIQAEDKNFSKVFEQVKARLENVVNNFKSFTKVMTQNNESFKRNVVAVGAQLNVGTKFGRWLRLATRGMRGFRMELLATLFAGMALKKAMFGMIKPAAQATGLFELWGLTMQVLFLPIMLEILPVFLKFIQFLIALPDPVKKALGGVVVILGGIGSLLVLIGQVGLGIGGLSQLNSLATGFGSIAKALKGLGIFEFSKDLGKLFAKDGPVLSGNISTAFRGMGWAVTKFMNKIRASKLGKTIIFAVALVATYKWAKTIDEMMTDVATAWSTRMKSVFEGMFAGATWGFLLGGPGGAVIGIVIGLAVSLAINIIDIFLENPEVLDDVAKMAGVPSGKGPNPLQILTRPFGTFLDLFRKPAPEFHDFISRPGQSPVSFSPDDTIVGFKGKSGLGSEITLNVTNNITVPNESFFERLIDESMKKVTDELRRTVITA